MPDKGASAESLDSDTAFMLFATTLVMLQTPGLGLTQAGLIRQKNALSMMLQTFLGMAIGSLLWFIVGFSLTFGRSVSSAGLIGDPFEFMFFKGVSVTRPLADLAPTIPAILFASFQMMFALMAPLIVSGAWVEKMTFNAFIVFTAAWPFLVYYPLAHWIWGPHGWLMKLGVEDFAGGVVIHTSAGVSALVVSSMLRRRIHTKELSQAGGYHNLPLALIGASFIWAGFAIVHPH